MIYYVFNVEFGKLIYLLFIYVFCSSISKDISLTSLILVFIQLQPFHIGRENQTELNWNQNPKRTKSNYSFSCAHSFKNSCLSHCTHTHIIIWQMCNTYICVICLHHVLFDYWVVFIVINERLSTWKNNHDLYDLDSS